MKEVKNYSFDITTESLDRIKYISKNMENKTFHFHTHILYDLRTSLGKKEVTYLEIGSYAGGSSSLMCGHSYKTKCFAIDLGFPIKPQIVESNVNRFKNEHNTFKYFVGNSQDTKTISDVTQEVGNVDILFIDGDHTKNGVFSDFRNYQNLVKSGGYICFDDYLDSEYSPEVMGAVDELVKNLNKNEFNIIGVIDYPQLSNFTTLKYNNIYIIQKK